MQEMKLAEYLSCIVRINAQEILVWAPKGTSANLMILL
jgi:hypothetical protein